MASSDFSGEDASPVPEPQPARIRLNSSFEARVKKTFYGIVSTLVSMPMRLSICATASQILLSLM